MHSNLNPDPNLNTLRKTLMGRVFSRLVNTLEKQIDNGGSMGTMGVPDNHVQHGNRGGNRGDGERPLQQRIPFIDAGLTEDIQAGLID